MSLSVHVCVCVRTYCCICMSRTLCLSWLNHFSFVIHHNVFSETLFFRKWKWYINGIFRERKKWLRAAGYNERMCLCSNILLCCMFLISHIKWNRDFTAQFCLHFYALIILTAEIILLFLSRPPTHSSISRFPYHYFAHVHVKHK